MLFDPLPYDDVDEEELRRRKAAAQGYIPQIGADGLPAGAPVPPPVVATRPQLNDKTYFDQSPIASSPGADSLFTSVPALLAESFRNTANKASPIPQDPLPNGVRINDGFDGAGNLMGGIAPMPNVASNRMLPVIDSFMIDEPVHTLGYAGTTGISAPSVDYSGMMRRQAAQRQAFNLMDLWSREDMSQSAAADKAAAMALAQGNKGQMARDKAIMLSANAKVPPAMADAEIRKLQDSGDITAEEATQMRLERQLSVPNEHGMLVGMPYDRKKGTLAPFLSRIPADMDPEIVKNFLMERRGITRDDVVKRNQQLLEAGISTPEKIRSNAAWIANMTMDPFNLFGGAFNGQINPDAFDINKLTPEQRTEFNAINRIFGVR